ncbi:hypothetical protein [Thermococcus sp.]|uniref:hypothetical protein n=1 Tax=Thermococcus sp. TaxID=35749 RepID=UPI0025CEDD19|nr:hypothetical protein [Thermococcus sp.]
MESHLWDRLKTHRNIFENHATEVSEVQNGGLVIFSGVIDFFIDAMILANWPEWSPRVRGIFVAVELIAAGASFIVMSLGAGSMKKRQRPGFNAL